MWLTEYFEEIAAEYGITVYEAESTLRQAAEQFYTHLLRCTVVCSVSDKSLTIKRYSDSGFGVREITVDLRKEDIHRMSVYLRNTYESMMIKNQYRLLKPFIGSAVQCTFLRYDNSEAIFYAESGLNRITAYCTERNIPQKEIHNYIPGQMLWFHVCGLFDKSAEVSFSVSRTSKTLVEKLFLNKGTTVHCIKRIAGAKSIIKVRKKIPKEHIQFVANELKERIIIEGLR